MIRLYQSLLDDEEDILDNIDAPIHQWISENCNINGTYTIDDGKINVKGNVILGKKVKEIVYPFGSVSGWFWAEFGSLISVKNLPEYVGHELSL